MPHDASERLIEILCAACLARLDAAPATFTPWERSFLRDVADRNELAHLTPGQLAKLQQIHAARVRGLHRG